MNAVISFRKVFLQPKNKRIRKALNEINSFVRKHEKGTGVWVSEEVNEFLHKNSKNIPRKISAVLLKTEKNVAVYLAGGKQLEEDIKRKKAEEKKKKEEPKKEAQPEQKQKIEEKREKERASQAVEIKTGRK
ncbi:MAG: hypothetical protein HYW50_00700 [Candidatus Diapherotrites archaeon]|nr:hypothetical protein [Candidatus Diapherotrites archaeon]